MNIKTIIANNNYYCNPFIIFIMYVLSWITIIYTQQRRCPWCNGYRRRKWTRRHEFKSWTTDYISHSTNTFGKGMNPIILPPAMGK